MPSGRDYRPRTRGSRYRHARTSIRGGQRPPGRRSYLRTARSPPDVERRPARAEPADPRTQRPDRRPAAAPPSTRRAQAPRVAATSSASCVQILTVDAAAVGVAVEAHLDEHLEIDRSRAPSSSAPATAFSSAVDQPVRCRPSGSNRPTRQQPSPCCAAGGRSCASGRSSVDPISATFGDASCSRDSPNSVHPRSCRIATSDAGKNLVTGSSVTSAGRPARSDARRVETRSRT